jgi:hypothetical protein
MPEQLDSDKEKGHSLLDALRKFRDITSLTRQEQALIICILLSIAFGALIQHYRRAYHLNHPAALPTPTPSLRAKDLYVVPTNPRSNSRTEREPESDR